MAVASLIFAAISVLLLAHSGLAWLEDPAVSPCRVFLTLTASATLLENERLVVNWESGCVNPPEWIGVYLTNPAVSNEPPKFKLHMTNGTSQKNYKTTDITVDEVYLPFGWDRRDIDIPKRTGPKCLPYYIASWAKGKIEILDCLKIQPNWMSQREEFGAAPLGQLFLPGTHCSGCYFNRSEAQTNTVQLYAVAQNFDVWQQLVLGVRYLDVSVTFDAWENGRFWITNENMSVMNLLNILLDIRKFIIYSGEVVVLDVHDFRVMDRDDNILQRSYEFLAFLENELGDIAVYSNATHKDAQILTLNEIRNFGRGLIITYDDERFVKENNLLWNPWQRSSLRDLEETSIPRTLSNLYARESNFTNGHTLIAIQGQMQSITKNLVIKSIRNRADAINRKVMDLISGPWTLNVNALELNYFMMTNLVDVAINTNMYKNFGDLQEANQFQSKSMQINILP